MGATRHGTDTPRDEEQPPRHGIGRRRFLRAGGVLAGAAGVSAVAASASPAHAADGDPVRVGREHAAQSPTTIRLAGGLDATLELYNPDGPTLFLEPHVPDWSDELAIGEIVNTDLGPIIGVDTGDGPSITYLVTGQDLEDVPTPFAAPPSRRLDTRSPAAFPALGSAAGAFDAAGRLRAGRWVDVELPAPPLQPFELPTDIHLTAAHLNVTAVGGLTGGYLTVCPPGPRPNTSTVNFVRGQTIANAAFTMVARVESATSDPRYSARIYTSATVHVVVDFTGGVRQASFPLPVEPATSARTGEPAPAARTGGSTPAARRARVRAELAARTRRLLGR